MLEWYDKTVINIVVSNFGFAIANSYIVSVVFIVSIIAVAITLYKIRYKSQESVLLFCTASTLTGLVILSEEKKYADTFVPYFSYYTLFSILLIIFTIIELAKLLNSLTDEYQISNYKHNYLGIIGSDTHPEEDLVGRKHEVRVVYDYLFSNYIDSQQSLAVAVTGTWGCGKTTFLNYLKDILKTEGIKYFDYTPWNRTDNNVTADFLNHLTEVLDPDDNGKNSLQEYIDSIKISNVTGTYGLVLHTLSYIFSDHIHSTHYYINRIRTNMAALEKPIVAIVDDVDRVGANDFREVLGLIRSTVDYPNLIYVVAFDRDIAIKLIDDENYLAKIFNLTLPLLPIGEKQMQKIFYDIVKKRFNDITDEDGNLENPLFDIEITEYLPTLRDLYRFVNLLSKEVLEQQSMIRQTYFSFNTYAQLILVKYLNVAVWSIFIEEPMKYLEVLNDSWNEQQRYCFRKDINTEDDKSLKLLSHIFHTERFAINEFVRPGGLQMLFMSDISKKYVTKQEFEDALQSHNFVEQALLWSKTKEGLIFCMEHNDMMPLEKMLPVLEAEVKNRTVMFINPKGELMFPVHNSKFISSFENIRKTANPYEIVGSEHSYYLILDQHFEYHVDTNAEITTILNYANNTNSPRELLAIINGVIEMCHERNEMPDKWMFDVYDTLFMRLATEENSKDINNVYAVNEALEYGHTYKSNFRLFLPLLKQNLNVWLSLTLGFDRQFLDTYIYVDARKLHLYFNTISEYQEMIPILREHFKNDEESLHILLEHEQLVRNTQLITVLSKDCFKVERYSHLEKMCEEEFPTSFFDSDDYAQTKKYHLTLKDNVPFYNNKSRLCELTSK